MDTPDSLFHAPLAAAQAKQMTMTALLAGHQHSASAALDRLQQPAAPRCVRRAEAFITAHADQPITVAGLARAVGVSGSSLHAGFRRSRGTSLMAFVRSVRLDRARAELRAASPGAITLSLLVLGKLVLPFH